MEHSIDALDVIHDGKRLSHVRKLFKIPLEVLYVIHRPGGLYEILPVRNRHDISQGCPAECVVEHAVRGPYLASVFKPVDHVVVDPDLRYPYYRDHDKEYACSDDHLWPVNPNVRETSQKSRGPTGSDVLPGRRLFKFHFSREDEHRRDKTEAQDSQGDGTEGNKPPEDPDGDYVHEDEDDKAGGGGKRRIAYRATDGAHRIDDRGTLVSRLPVSKIELVEDVDAVGGYRHEKDRRHRAHDVDRKAKADQEPQAPDDRYHRIHHERDGEKRVPKHEISRCKHQEACDRRKDRHEPEHVRPECVPGHGVARNVVFLLTLFLRRYLPYPVRDLLAVCPLLERDVEGGRLSVIRDDVVHEERVFKKRLLQGPYLRFILRRLRHEGGHLERPVFRRDIRYRRESAHIPGRDTFCLEDLVRDPHDLSKRLPVEDASLVHNPQDENVLVEAERPVDLVVPDPHIRGLGEHVLGIRVNLRLE